MEVILLSSLLMQHLLTASAQLDKKTDTWLKEVNAYSDSTGIENSRIAKKDSLVNIQFACLNFLWLTRV